MATNRRTNCRQVAACACFKAVPGTHLLCPSPLLSCRAGTELSPSWPGFYEGAIFTGDQAASTVGALLKGSKA